MYRLLIGEIESSIEWGNGGHLRRRRGECEL